MGKLLHNIEKNERLKIFRLSQKLTQSNISTIVGAERSTYVKTEQGYFEVPIRYVELLHAKFNLNPVWFLTGKGEMLLPNNDTTPPVPVINIRNLPFEGSDDIKPVPLYNMRATAGDIEIHYPQTLTSDDVLFLPFLKGNDFALTVYGESMEPIVESGDIVAVKETHINNLSNGKIYLIDVGNNLYLKYAYPLSTELLILNSENKLHPPITIPKSEIRKIFEVNWVIRTRKV